jgi:ABC-type glycerol-3-phosphate transport system permease component
MKRLLRFVLLFAAALALVPFLPLYIERTMLRSFRTGSLGDSIEWGWKICSLSEYWSNYRHISREQDPAYWLSVNLALAVVYAVVIALCVDLIFRLWRRRRTQAS